MRSRNGQTPLASHPCCGVDWLIVLCTVATTGVTRPASRAAQSATMFAWPIDETSTRGRSRRRYPVSGPRLRSTRRECRSTTLTVGGSWLRKVPSAAASTRSTGHPRSVIPWARLTMTRSAPPPRREGRKNAIGLGVVGVGRVLDPLALTPARPPSPDGGGQGGACGARQACVCRALRARTPGLARPAAPRSPAPQRFQRPD